MSAPVLERKRKSKVLGSAQPCGPAGAEPPEPPPAARAGAGSRVAGVPAHVLVGSGSGVTMLCRILMPLSCPDAKASPILMPSPPAERNPSVTDPPHQPPPPELGQGRGGGTGAGKATGAQSLNLRLACIFL